MARVFHDGNETGRHDLLWSRSTGHSSGTQGSTTRKSGNYSIGYIHSTSIASTSGASRNLGANLVEHYGRSEFYLASMSGTNRIIVFRDDGGSHICSIGFSVSTGLVNVHLYRATTLLASHSEAFSTGTWVRLEWHLVVDDTSGVFELKRNGDSILSFNGDTRGSASVNGVRTLGLGRLYSSSNDLSVFFDDIAINDTTGSVNNSWVGPGSILLLKPKGPGNYTQWTPDSGNNFARVNEIPYSAAAYVESDTADQIDTYEMQELAADLGVDTSDPSFNIKAVQHLMMGRWQEAETELARVLRLGGVDNTGTAVTLSNAYYRYWDEMFNVNPFDSQPWEVADLNNLEAGIKHKEWGGP